jgi:hypothetical protein
VLKICTMLAALTIGAIIDCGPIQAADVAHGETSGQKRRLHTIQPQNEALHLFPLQNHERNHNRHQRFHTARL